MGKGESKADNDEDIMSRLARMGKDETADAVAYHDEMMERYNKTKGNSIAVAVHVVSWILQFVGHGKFEGRKPALLDNLVQALFLAPLFVWYEVLFKMGFYKGLKREVELGVEDEIAKLKAKKADKGKGIALDDSADTMDDVVDAVLDEEKEGSDEI